MDSVYRGPGSKWSTVYFWFQQLHAILRLRHTRQRTVWLFSLPREKCEFLGAVTLQEKESAEQESEWIVRSNFFLGVNPLELLCRCGEADITPTMVSCLPGWTVYYVSVSHRRTAKPSIHTHKHSNNVISADQDRHVGRCIQVRWHDVDGLRLPAVSVHRCGRSPGRLRIIVTISCTTLPPPPPNTIITIFILFEF